MKKQVTLLCASVLLLGGLASCNQNNNIELSQEESLGLRAASGLNMLGISANETKKVQRANEDIPSTDIVQEVLPSIDILLSNNFHVKVNEVEEGKYEFKGSTYTFKLNINFKDETEKATSLSLYYNHDLTLDAKYDEAIEGLIIFNEIPVLNFKSTVLANIDGEALNFDRNLSLFVKDDLISYQINEVSRVKKGELVHKLEYALTVAGKSIVSYAVDLNTGSNSSVTFTLLGMECRLTKVVEEGKVMYNISFKLNDVEISTSLKFEKVVNEDGSVSFTLILG